MSGKAYTMREMKTIVDYLAEHKAYHEIKGRKMWIDLQDSKVTNRTWQSLKETFIKRILPNISDPYYKLSTQQITSFKQGYDVEARINNRLDIRSVSRDSNTDGEIKKKCGEIESHDNKTGEENKQTDIRDSTETLVLENYEDPDAEQDKGQGTKTLRELITYSEPLTPMLQVVIEDYTSDGDGSNDEPKMQIVEAPESDIIQSNEELIEVLEGSDEEKSKGNNERIDNETSNKSQTEIPESTKEQTTDKDNNGESSILLDTDIPPNKEATTLEKTTNTKDNLNSQSKSTENISNSTTDTFLPGNQEALNDKDNKTTHSDKALETLKVTSSKHGKRRANSQEDHTTSKKKILDSDSEKKTNTDVDTLKKKNKKIDLKKLKMNVKNLVEESQQNAKNDNQEGSKYKNICGDEEIAQTSKNVENTQEFENPCLKSVSLYEEQFSNKKYSDSDNTNEEDIQEKNKMNTDPNKKVNAAPKNVTVCSEVNEIVVLKSHSESVSDSDKPPATTKQVSDRVRQQRDRALTNMFGFASGGVNKNRRRTSSFRKHATVRRKLHNISTDSSEWTSDTGSEYVSPPRGRKNMQTRKYLKPKSARVLSLEEEGGLFVMYGKKIYPVVKDGKIFKNYVSFTPEDDVDPEESYWKLKYVEEKKRTAELTKLLNQVKDKNDQEKRIPEVPTTSDHTDYIPSPVKREGDKIASDNMVVPVKTAQMNKVEAGAEEKTVKVKFTKNNEEVQLEGHWSHVNPVLAQVLQLLQKEPEPLGQRPNPKRETLSEVSSAKSSSVIVNEQDEPGRVNKLENEIFKEIEQTEKEVPVVEKTSTSNDSLPKPDDRNVTKSEENVTKRKGRPRKSPTNQTAKAPAKKSKLNLDVEEEKPIAARRTPRTPKKPENNNIKANSTPKTRQSTPNKMKQSNIIEESQAKYKLPSPNKNTTTSNGKEVKNTRLRKSNSPTSFKIYTSLDIAYNSADSTRGYCDSDPSPLRISVRKKKKLSYTCPTYKPKYRVRNRSTFLPSLTEDDSSNSYQGSVKSVTFENSSLSSNIYKSESYQLLMNNNMSLFNKNTTQKLEIINEIDPVSQETQIMTDENNEIVFDLEDKSSSERRDAISITNTDSQSSNMTLPTSPVLSIVENISINKSIVDNLAFNEDVYMIDNDCTNKVILNNLMRTGVDASMPLMQQKCNINSTVQDGMEYHYNISSPVISVVSESLLNKINTVNIEDPISDSINDKLKDLILESNKKGRKRRFSLDKNMEQDENENTDTKKTKTKKRSSTPRKRQSTRKLKCAQNEPCIEEEHMETCSQISRKSCPPVVQPFDEINNNNDLSVTLETNNDKPKTKSRRKKDIIKVKISKPKKKTNESVQKKQSYSQIDSGINDSEFSHLQISEDSVDLIHNHSETCVNANECLEPSIEVIENQKSIISIDSSYADNSDIHEKLSQELYCTDAQDGTQMNTAISDNNLRYESATATIFHTPLGSLSPPYSLFTEDLSDETLSQVNRNTKWYLFSEDETTNTFDIGQIGGQSSAGANLNQIFPITCSVPNLSTITEISKDNDENTRKFSEGTNSRNDIDLQSLFTKY